MIINRTQNVNGNNVTTAVAEVPVTAKAVHKATLMKEDFVKLVFDSDVDYKFKAGDWVELVQGGMPYILADDYFPTMKDEATFSYELQFNAPWYNLDKIIFLFNTYIDGSIIKRESDWYITDTAKNILSLIIRSTQDEDRHCPCIFNEVLDCEPTVVKTFTFSSTSILSALNNLAKEFELEWWVTYEGGEYYLHFGECDNSITRDANGAVTFDGETNVRERDASLAIQLTAGENVTKPSVSQKEGLKRKYYVFGSSRNIDQNAVQDMENGFVTSIVTKRLELAGNPQDMGEGSGEEVVIFDDIYPRSDYQITGVTPVEIITDEVLTYDEQGNPAEYKRYNVYNLQIKDFSDYIFSLIENDPNVQNVEDIIASGKPLSLKFISKEVSGETFTPTLAGFEFELAATLVTDEVTGNRWYEFQIQHQDINGYIVPNDNLIPKVGDWVCVFNVKGAYIGGLNSNNGQDDLRAAFNKWYANKKRDVSYTVKPYANEDIDLEIGDAVVLSYKDNTVTSRVYSYEKALDLLLAGLGCSDASYTISSYAKTGSVNQLKEDVKVLTASIANGTAGGSIDASSVQNAIATYGRRLFLSKVTEDTADGHITFKEGVTSRKDSSLQRTTFGTFRSGFLGSGAVVDQYGNAEVKSLYSREFISTPEFRFNRITVTEGEQWNTNAFGIIEDVRKINGNDCIVLKLEDGDLPSVKYGDLCRGMYSNIGYEAENGVSGYNNILIDDHLYDIDEQPDLDDCNFPTKNGFFTSYFMVLENPKYYEDEDGKKHWYFRFITKSKQVNNTNSTPLPCKNMKFAQYGNPYNTDRQSSFYQTSIRHSYIQQLEYVDDWAINPWNIASRYGYLGDLTVRLKNTDGTTYDTTLKGNGLYVQDNVYFGNATIQLDPVTIEDIKRQLANYSIQLSAYTDVIKVDDAGNVIDGLWKDTGEAPNISRQYRIFSVITARNGITPLTIEEDDVPCGAGKFKVYVQPYGCSCKLENSTLYITHIDNVKDGIAGSEDDVNFDYDACRAMERVWVDLRVECEGVGSILATMPITIKHDPVPYIFADLTNENAGVSWSTEDNEFIGLPVETYVNMAKGNEDLKIVDIVVNTINGITPQWTTQMFSRVENAYVYEDENILSRTYGWGIRITPWYLEETELGPAVGDEDRPLAALLRIVKMPKGAPSVTEILFTCRTNYAGVNYERTLSLHITRTTDMVIWDIVPNHHSISVDRNAYFNFSYVGVQVYCMDKLGKVAVSELPEGLHLDYRITMVLPVYTAVTSPTGNPVENGWYELSSGDYVLTSDTSVQSGKSYYMLAYETEVGEYTTLSDPTAQVRVNDPSYADTITAIEFTLFDDDNVMDSEEVLVVREGLGGQGSTGPAGNGVQQVTDYYLRAKDGFTPHYPDPLGYIPEGTDAALVETAQAYPSGWRANTYTPPTKGWPNVWHFTKYDYTHSPDYDTPPSLITTYSEDGNSIEEIHTYYLKTNEENVHNIYRLDQEEGEELPWIQDVFTEPDNGTGQDGGRVVWRYFAFKYKQQINGTYYAYSPIEFVAKWVEDGASFQCAYKVFPAKHEVSGELVDYKPELDSVSTGANMPATNSSSWSATTTGLVVSDGYVLWMTQRTYKGTNYGTWGDPVRISGHKGETGADGTDIEFIYKLSNDGNPTAAEKPTYGYDDVNDTYWSATIDGVEYKFDEDDFNPSNVPNASGSNLGWTDNPSGVSTEYKYEWMCQRVKKKGSQHWGDWTNPVVWSAYGDTGMDGDGVEYVFRLYDTKPNTPNSPAFFATNGVIQSHNTWYGGVEKVNGVWLPKGWTAPSGYTFSRWDGGSYSEQGEWKPENWEDDPTGVSKGAPKEWVSVRKKVNGKWKEFSEPALWATYSETPNIRIVGGYWWLGDDYLRDENNNPVKAEGENGTGIALKGRVSTFNDLLAITPVPKKGDCYVVSTTRHLWVYIGDESANHTIIASDWQDMGEFQGAAGANSQLHFAWARSVDVIRDQDGEITDITSFITAYEDLDPNVDYEWMGIATTNSVDNPTKKDPSEWDAYKWNHAKGRDGEFFERIYMTTSLYLAPEVNTNYSDADFQTPEFLPFVKDESVQACGASYYRFYDDPIGDTLVNGRPHYELYPYEWMLERKKVDGVWQPFSAASLWARHGKDGEGVTSIDTYYLKTTMSSGVNYTTDESSWVKNVYQVPDADKPYVWRYTESFVGLVSVGRSQCELIAVYNSAPNINLLDDTAFSSDVAMEAWSLKGYVKHETINGISQSADPTADPSSPNYDSQSFNNFFGVTTGTQGHNAYLGRFRGTNTSAYIVLLQQEILNAFKTKVEAGKWYTLSYLVKGNAESMFDVSLRGTKNGAATDYVNKSEGMYVNGTLRQNIYSYQFKYASGHYSTEWTKHVITFKVVDNLDVDTAYVQWTMYNRPVEHQIYVCMPKLEVGLVATTYSDGQTSTKAFPRTGEWRKGEQYYAGNIGERYLDAVHYGLNNFGYPAWFKCIRTHISSDENSPTSANGRLYWDAGSWDGFIATGLLLAQYAFIENLGVGILRTGEPNEPHVEMFDSIARFFGNGGHKSIELATDDDGVGVLRFYDKAGNAMYDLGPNGIMENFSQVPTSFLAEYYKPITTDNMVTALVVVGNNSVSELGHDNNWLCYKITEGYKALRTGSSIICTYNISETSTPSPWNGARVLDNNYTDEQLQEISPVGNAIVLEDGWYCGVWIGVEAVGLDDDLKYVEIYHFVSGKITKTKKVYFKDSDLIANGNNGSWYDEAGNKYTHQSLGIIMTDDFTP